MHTRQSVLFRLVTHDAYHTGEMSLDLGSHGLGEIDLWRGLARIARYGRALSHDLSGRRESNPHFNLGGVACGRYNTPARELSLDEWVRNRWQFAQTTSHFDISWSSRSVVTRPRRRGTSVLFSLGMR